MMKESVDLEILGVIFASKMTFEKHRRSVSRSVFSKAWYPVEICQVFHYRLLVLHHRKFSVFCFLFLFFPSMGWYRGAKVVGLKAS